MMSLKHSPLFLITLLALAGCAVGPTYQAPAAPAAKAWSAPLPHAGSTTQLVDWWGQFNDPALTSLLKQAEAASPSLATAWANIASARASLATSQSGFWPQLSASASVTRSNNSLDSLGGATTSTTSAYSSSSGSSTTYTGGLDASWEIDLFGKLRRNREAAQATLQARVDDWHEARVSLAAEVADTYVQYRACQLDVAAYTEENDSQQQTARLTALSVKAGFTSPADGALAEASAASVHAQLLSQQADCEVLVKSLVDLVGGDEAALRSTLGAGGKSIPEPAGISVSSVPADLVRQRPDLASSERALAAATAKVGAAEADRYPSFSLTGSISRSQSEPGVSLNSWSFGPSLSLPLFDAGQRRAAVSSAEASRDAALASYQQAVRDAVMEVEQALVRLDSAARRTQDASTAAEGYRRYFEATNLSWKAGNDSLLTREEARRNSITADINQISLQLEQVQQWIALYKALGGGWTSNSVATAPATRSGGETL